MCFFLADGDLKSLHALSSIKRDKANPPNTAEHNGEPPTRLANPKGRSRAADSQVEERRSHPTSSCTVRQKCHVTLADTHGVGIVPRAVCLHDKHFRPLESCCSGLPIRNEAFLSKESHPAASSSIRRVLRYEPSMRPARHLCSCCDGTIFSGSRVCHQASSVLGSRCEVLENGSHVALQHSGIGFSNQSNIIFQRIYVPPISSKFEAMLSVSHGRRVARAFAADGREC